MRNKQIPKKVTTTPKVQNLVVLVQPLKHNNKIYNNTHNNIHNIIININNNNNNGNDKIMILISIINTLYFLFAFGI